MLRVLRFLIVGNKNLAIKTEDNYDLKDFLYFLFRYSKVFILAIVLGLIIGFIFSLNKTKFYKSAMPVEISKLSYDQSYEMKENVIKNTRYHFYFLLYSDLFNAALFDKLFQIRPEVKTILENYGINVSKINKLPFRLIDIASDESLTFLYVNTEFPFIIKDNNIYNDLLVAINHAVKLFNEAQLNNYLQFYEKNRLEIEKLTKKNKLIFNNIYEKNIILYDIFMKTSKKNSINFTFDSNYPILKDEVINNKKEFSNKIMDNNISQLFVGIYSNLAFLKSTNEITDSDYSYYLGKIAEISSEYERLNLELSSNNSSIKNLYTEINSYFQNPKNFYLPNLAMKKNSELIGISSTLIPINHFVYVGSGAITGLLFAIIICFIHSIFFNKSKEE
ncbi:hypothetical protein [Pigmentibacter ruber]|uniref:hypothetical protein n=1 Tax=Pigmentibacter ruber TaxID=2683196 RepID=UPI00131C27D0|nr:hypothetical protein [Pigmentibacter ruber]